MRASWLPDVLADAGLDPRVVPGWRGRGRDMATVHGIVVHDTVTPSTTWTNARVDRLLRDGRTGLPGPLAQLGVDFDARPVVIADGRANHNGYGTWGNDTFGIEVYCAGGLAGRQEPWSPAQRETVVAMCRAILAHLELGPSSHWNPRVAGHKETDPRRKIDPYRVDVAALRRDVAADEEEIVASLNDLRRVVADSVPSLVAKAVEPIRNQLNRTHQRLNEATRLAEAAVVAEVARIRAEVGLPPDGESDAIQARYVREGRRGGQSPYGLVEVRQALEAAAEERH